MLLKFKRLRERKTNYKKRKIFVISSKIRFVVRITNNYIILQAIKCLPKGDVTLAAFNTINLKKFGWNFSCKNLPASYLGGYILGKEMLKKGIKEGVLDIGFKRATKGGKVFAAVKGALDAGIKIPVDEEMLPDEERISGKHISEYARILKEKDPSLYQKRFSGLLSKGLDPESIPEYFYKIKQIIIDKLG